jgi:hypothetical protein
MPSTRPAKADTETEDFGNLQTEVFENPQECVYEGDETYSGYFTTRLNQNAIHGQVLGKFGSGPALGLLYKFLSCFYNWVRWTGKEATVAAGASLLSQSQIPSLFQLILCNYFSSPNHSTRFYHSLF